MNDQLGTCVEIFLRVFPDERLIVPLIFYDLGDYIDAICNDEMLLSEFQAQMTKCIPHKAHTAQVYAYSSGVININVYSGISTSALSKNDKCISYTETEWYKNTRGDIYKFP